MTAYVLSPRAQADVDEIWNYTAERWGDDQAERYARAIMQAIETIARDPSKGRSSDRIRPGYRRFSVGSHVLFFRVVADEIDVVRVLHRRMDFDRHL
jgi:toxin ParE1/3/4